MKKCKGRDINDKSQVMCRYEREKPPNKKKK